MSDINCVHTKTDVLLLQKLVSKTTEIFAMTAEAEPKTLLPYIRSDLANASLIMYQYLIKDAKTDEEKLRTVSDSVIEQYAGLAAKEYQGLLEYRHQSMSKGMHVYSELSFSLESTLTYMIGLTAPLAKLNPALTLIPDLFLKFFSQSLGLLKMLNLDLASEAYSNWRTLHEAECVIKLLVEGGKQLQEIYIRHLIYNNAFRHAIPDENETDRIFVELKGKMAQHGLKSKDMKKFIEYGWLYSCKTFHEENREYKLNFRDGLQKAAGLEEYNEWYEMASEMAHSSPIFFYSNNVFFSDLTAVNLADITMRSIQYFNQYISQAKIDIYDKRLYLDILVSNLKTQTQKEDDSFYTKYKDYLETGDSDNGNGEEK